MRKLFIGFLGILVVDLYFFDFTMRIFPVANTKMILAVIGIIAFMLDGIRNRQPQLSKRVIISGFLAVLFSLWCYVAITINGSNNRDYVTYFASFGTWLGGAYGVYALLKLMNKRVDLLLVSRFLALAGIAQCILALLIDEVPFIHDWVESTILMATDFYERKGRLYGIGCALDPAGVRFSVIQIMIAHQLARENRVRSRIGASILLIVCFLIITVIGSMISRTTIVGTGLGLFYIVVVNFAIQKGGVISKLQLSLSLLLVVLIGAAVVISVYLYNTNSTFHDDLRFGFEGFFNWIESGEFRTTSTDHLNTMWVWPESRRGWIIGEGRVGVFQTNSDIGYCNYILYCGLIGLSIFSIFFVFNHLSLISKFRRFSLAALLLTACTFIVWCKVTTDIFMIDALLFCIEGDIETSVPQKT